MKSNLIIYCSALSVFLFLSCKSQKETATTPVPPTPKIPQTQSQPVNSTALQTAELSVAPIADEPIDNAKSQNDMNKVYDLIITFTSKGEGIDYKTKEKLDQFLANKNDSYSVETYQRGREGETAYCFDFGKISPENKVKMRSKISSFVKDNPLVFIEENTVCRYKK